MVLMMRALHRLQERLAGFQFRRDPVFRIDLRHHAAPVGVFAQHELDELGARGERGEPEAARRRPATAATDRPADCRARRAGCRRRDRDQAMPPAFADQDVVAGGAGAERVVRVRRRSCATLAARRDRATSTRPLRPRSIRSCDPLPHRAASLEPSVAISVPCGPGDSALTAFIDGIGEASRSAAAADGRREHLHLARRRARPRCRRPAGSTAR